MMMTFPHRALGIVSLAALLLAPLCAAGEFGSLSATASPATQSNGLHRYLSASFATLMLPQVSTTQAEAAAGSEQAGNAVPGAVVYKANCAVCHGAQRQGNPPAIPALAGVSRRLSREQIASTVHNGHKGMPAFPNLKPEQIDEVVRFLDLGDGSQAPAAAALSPAPLAGSGATPSTHDQMPNVALITKGGELFQQNCAFCHGRDAGGGESGPDLTRSKLVSQDVNGNKISEVVHNGRTDKGMPQFNFGEADMASLVAFIHNQATKAAAGNGKRRGVDVSDLQTGNAEAGKAYFNGAGGCTACHSATGDLAGIASHYQGLQLEERFLYPRDAKSTVTVTPSSGQSVHGTLAYLDEFTIGLRESDGTYRSWPRVAVKEQIDSPVEGHVKLFSKYTDDDIHNMMAYLQTLR